MKSAIAYILIIVLGQFAFTIGTLIGSGLFGMIFYYLPLRIKMPIAGFCAGALASLAVAGFGYVTFWLFGIQFGVYPFLACIVSMLIPLRNDYRLHAARKQNAKEPYSSEFVVSETKALIAFSATSLIGAVAGIAFVAWYTLG